MTRRQSILMLIPAVVLYGGIFPVNRMGAEAGWPAIAFARVPAVLGGVALVSAGAQLPTSTLTLVLCLSPILTLTIAAATGSERCDRRLLLVMSVALRQPPGAAAG
jgi:hypothetical protein